MKLLTKHLRINIPEFRFFYKIYGEFFWLPEMYLGLCGINFYRILGHRDGMITFLEFGNKRIFFGGGPETLMGKINETLRKKHREES